MRASGRNRDAAVAVAVCCAVAIPAFASAAAACVGDCDGDGRVRVDEIVRMVDATLGADVTSCPAGDPDRSRAITIDEIVVAVTGALYGCSMPSSAPDFTGLFPRPKLFVGDEPRAMSAADLNGDGLADLVTSDLGSGSLSVLLRAQGGGFEPRRGVSVGGRPVDVKVARLGVAHDIALLVADAASNRVSVAFYESDRVETNDIGIGSIPVELAIEDLNGDTLPDVIVANGGSSGVTVLLGTAEGGFEFPATFATHGNPRSLAAGNLDGDPFPDVVVAVGTRQLAFLRSSGGGALEAAREIDVGAPALAVRVADLDGDLVDDLVVLVERERPDSVDVIALHGCGDGSFHSVGEIVARTQPVTLTVADVDGDGIVDVVTGNEDSVSVFFGRGDGTFLDEVVLGTETLVSAVVVADVDANGSADVIYTNPVDDEVSIFWNRGGRDLATEEVYPVGGKVPVRLSAPDVDGDGLPDLATLNQVSDDVSILLNAGDGSFDGPVLVAAEAQLRAMAFGYFDDDQVVDMVTGFESRVCGSCLAAFRGRGDGGFVELVPFSVAARVAPLAVGRVNADDIDDLVTLSGSGVTVFLGLGNLAFGSAGTFPVGSVPRALTVADLNGDGLDDVATANAASVSVLLGVGDGGLSAPATVPVTADAAYIAAADLDSDGTIDLVARGGGRIAVLLGWGGGRFSQEISLPLVASGGAFDLADVNADGRTDLLTLSDGLAIYPGVQTNVFAPPQRFASNPLAVEALVADFDNDGRADIATVNAAFDGSVSVTLGAVP